MTYSKAILTPREGYGVSRYDSKHILVATFNFVTKIWLKIWKDVCNFFYPGPEHD